MKENLIRKYNCGIILNSNGTFFHGMNEEEMEAWAQSFKDGNTLKHYAQKFKEIMRKEFNIPFRCRSHGNELTAVINISSDDLFKKWDDMSENEREEVRTYFWNYKYRSIIENIGVESYNSDELDKIVKFYYEKIYIKTSQQDEDGKRMGMIDNYSDAFFFASRLLESWNYDHIALNPGDADYCDRCFYETIGYNITDFQGWQDYNNANNQIIESLKALKTN